VWHQVAVISMPEQLDCVVAVTIPAWLLAWPASAAHRVASSASLRFGAAQAVSNTVVVMPTTCTGYISQRTRGDLVVGAGIDGLQRLGQRAVIDD